MIEIVEGLATAERELIGRLRAGQQFFWIDVPLSATSGADLGNALGIPGPAMKPLVDFTEGGAASRKLHADGQHVIFPFSCYVESTSAGPPAAALGPHSGLGPIEVHVLVSGDYLLTLHEEPISLPRLLAPDVPEGRSEQYAVYAILDAMVATSYEALTETEDTLEELQLMSTDLRSGRVRMATLRGVNSRLSGMRRRVAPQRGIFERISVEIGSVEGLEADSERYFERIGQQLNRLVEAIDAAANAMASLIELRLNETTYWLTVVATIFLPLTFVTGFFGMNFKWMIAQVDTPLAFWLLGVGTLALGVALIWRLIVRGSPVQEDEDTAKP